MASVPAESVPNTAGVFLASEDGTEVLVDHHLTQKSECLKTALDCHAQGTDRPLVMVSADVLSAWLAFVQHPDHQHGDLMSVESLEAVLRPRESATHPEGQTVHMHWSLPLNQSVPDGSTHGLTLGARLTLEAADLLIDKETTAEVAHLIASRLFTLSPAGVPGLGLKNSHQSAASLDSLESAPSSPVANTGKPLSRGRKISANVRRLFAKVMRSSPRQHVLPEAPSTPSMSSRSDHTDMEIETDSSTASQVLGRVSEDLALSILHAAPNVFTLLSSLPPKLHPLALRAHNPSIDSHHSLVFHFREASTAVPAARAAASVPHITALAFNAVRTPHCALAPQNPTHAAAIFRAIADMPCLSSFTLKGWILDLDGEVQLSQQLRQPAFGGGRLRHLGLSHLRAPMTVLPPALAAFAGSLTALDLSHSHLSDTAAQTLALYVGDLRELRRLLLGCTHLEDAGWDALAPQLGRLTALDALDVSGVHVSARKLFTAALAAAASASSDTGDGSDESAAIDVEEAWGAGALVDTMWQRLESLDISHNRQLRHLPCLGARLACMERLHSLNCAGMGLFGEHAVDALRDMGTLSLRAVDWSYNDLSAGAEQLSACLRSGWRGLTSLTLTRAEIRCGAAEALADSLVCLQELRELHMPRNGLAQRGAVALAPAIGALGALRVLSLAQNELGDVGAQAIAQHAPHLVHLEVLDLSGNGVGAAGAAAVVESAAVMPLLHVVGLQGNALGEEGAAAVVDALMRCPRVCDGGLSDHGVSPCVFQLGQNGFKNVDVDALRAAESRAVILKLDGQ